LVLKVTVYVIVSHVPPSIPHSIIHDPIMPESRASCPIIHIVVSGVQLPSISVTSVERLDGPCLEVVQVYPVRTADTLSQAVPLSTDPNEKCPDASAVVLFPQPFIVAPAPLAPNVPETP